MTSKKVHVPDWMGNFPFRPEEKKPVVITHDMEVSAIYLYGTPPHQIRVQKYVSTDKITMGDFTISPGERFEPAGYHPGPEFYYVLEGTATPFNPETGEVYQVKEGETFLINKHTWHQVFNFGDEELKILSIAPILYSKTEKSEEIEFSGEPKFYTSDVKVPQKWPPLTEEARPHAKGMIFIPQSEFLHLIHGEKYHVLISLFMRNELMQAGLITVPIKQFSESEVHQGDEVVYVLEGILVVKTVESVKGEESISERSYEIGEGEKFLIPEKVEHQYFNLTDKRVKAIFAIAPGS